VAMFLRLPGPVLGAEQQGGCRAWRWAGAPLGTGCRAAGLMLGLAQGGLHGGAQQDAWWFTVVVETVQTYSVFFGRVQSSWMAAGLALGLCTEAHVQVQGEAPQMSRRCSPAVKSVSGVQCSWIAAMPCTGQVHGGSQAAGLLRGLALGSCEEVHEKMSGRAPLAAKWHWTALDSSAKMRFCGIAARRQGSGLLPG
jgi:hypothetical protein